MPSWHCSRISRAPARVASARATSVLPTPASPSSSSGCSRVGGEEDARGERPVGQVALAGERAGDLLRRAELHVQQCDAWRGCTRAPERSRRAAEASYERGRPGWPVEAVEIAARRLGLDASPTGARLAARAGKLTRGWPELAAQSVESPSSRSSGMRAVLRRARSRRRRRSPASGRADPARRRRGSIGGVRRRGHPLVRPRSALAEIGRVAAPR